MPNITDEKFESWVGRLNTFIGEMEQVDRFKEGMTDKEACGNQKSPAHILIKDVCPAYSKYLAMMPSPTDMQAASVARKRGVTDMYSDLPAPAKASKSAAVGPEFKVSEVIALNLHARHLWAVCAEYSGLMEHAPLAIIRDFVEQFCKNEKLKIVECPLKGIFDSSAHLSLPKHIVGG